jgi:hypothetical protein
VRVLRTGRAADRTAGADQRFVHDPPDGAGATAALSAASQATVNLPGGARPLRGTAGRAHVAIAQDIAGANNHRNSATLGTTFRYFKPRSQSKEKRPIL